jgi:hypothetical protein
MSNTTQLEAHLFAVEFTYPHHYETKNNAGETVPLVQNRNEQRYIFCATAERAIEIVHQHRLGATVHVVRKVGARTPPHRQSCLNSRKAGNRDG